MSKVLGFIVAAAVIVAIMLGIDWLLWKLWCWVLPQVWVSGPSNLLAPSFWLFVGAWTLLSLFGRALFGSRKGGDK